MIDIEKRFSDTRRIGGAKKNLKASWSQKETTPFKVGDKIVALATFDNIAIVEGIVYTVKRVVRIHDRFLPRYFFEGTYVEHVSKDIPIASFRLATHEEINESKTRFRALILARDGVCDFNPYLEIHKLEMEKEKRHRYSAICKDIMEGLEE